MYKVTNQQLYNDIRQGLDGVQISEFSAEEMYSVIQDTLRDQDEFSEELIDKCASIAFDAVNDLYMESRGTKPQTSFSNENIEELFTAENQELYATWIGRGLAYLNAVRKGAGAMIGNTSDSYSRKVSSEYGGRAERFGNSGKAGMWSRFKQTAAGHMDDVRARDRAKKENIAERAEKVRKRKEDKAKGTFLSGFRDNKGKLFGLNGGEGIKKWAKDNKGHAALVAGGTAALVGGGGYLAYRAYKKRKAAQAQQAAQSQQAGLNSTHQIQPNVR
jgi:hypothetical protein